MRLRKPNLDGWDYRPNVMRDRDLAAHTLLWQLGVVGKPNSKGSYEKHPSFDQTLIAEERRATRQMVEAFLNDPDMGWQPWFVTAVHPDWARRPGALEPDVVRLVRERSQRKARDLRKHCDCIVIGVVDLAYQDRRKLGQTAFWSPHAHMMVLIRGTTPKEAKRLLQRSFRCPKSPELGMHRNVHVAALDGKENVAGVCEYNSSKLLAEVDRRRSYFVGNDGEAKVKRFPLLKRRNAEFHRFRAQVANKDLWILSGVKRNGSKFQSLYGTPRRH